MITRKLFSAALLVLACASMHASQEQWLEVRSDHFIVVTDSSDREARQILEQFERMRWFFRRVFPTLQTDPSQPLLVVAAKNQKTFAQFESTDYLKKGQLQRAGVFMRMGDANYILLRLDAEARHPYATIFHEYTHLQLAPAQEWLPLWLNEGLAMFYENSEFSAKSSLFGEPDPDRISYLRQTATMPITTLFQVDSKSPYYHEEHKGSVFYAESWALTHLLIQTDFAQKTSRLSEYMRLVGNHQDPVAAAQQAFGDLKRLQDALDAYIRVGEYKALTIHTGTEVVDDSTFKSRPLTPTEVDVDRARILVAINRQDEAHELLLTVVKSSPNNADAMEALGDQEFLTGNLDQARIWYGKAVDANSQSYLAYFRFATFARSSSEEDQTRVEPSLRKAIALNPKSVDAYEVLAQWLSRNPETRAEAVKVYGQAAQVAPGNFQLRLGAASTFMAMERWDEAKDILSAASKLARTDNQKALVAERLQQINKFKSMRETEAADTARAAAEPMVETVNLSPRIANSKPKHPTLEAKGPLASVTGVIHEVHCSFPTEIEFQLELQKGSASLYNNDFRGIDLTALGFTPSGSINPCTDFDGFKARVKYIPSREDHSVTGQIVFVELRK